MPDALLPMTRADLDLAVRGGCQDPTCTHRHDTDGLLLQARCHPGGRTWVCYQDGVLTITCGRCRAFIAAIAVAPGPTDATGFDLSTLARFRRP